jgi:hypothetical protein
MPLDLIALALGAAVLIAGGVLLRKRAERKDSYILLAHEAGFKPEDMEASYQSYRTNKLMVANLLLWLGIGLLVAATFRLW